MRLLLLLLCFGTCYSQYQYTDFSYNIKNKHFKCSAENVYNIKMAISTELNISYNDVEVTCGDLISHFG